MGLTTIPWTDYSFNPWRGCRRVSPGCVNCYIDRTPIFRFTKQKHEDRVRSSEATLAVPYSWNKAPWICDSCGKAIPVSNGEGKVYCKKCDALQPCHRARVFLGSLMDIFDDEIPIQWFADAMQVVFDCEQIDFLLVTKRPENALNRLFEVWDDDHCKLGARPWIKDWLDGKPPKNVWVIASAEDQARLEKRVPELLKIPAVVHGLSCEPLLGPLKFFDENTPDHLDPFWNGPECNRPCVNWVIAGGESGPKARNCRVEWIRDIQRQCDTAGVAYFAKQLGSHPVQDLSAAIPEADIADTNLDAGDIAAWEYNRHNCLIHLRSRKGENPDEWPDASMRVRQWPESLIRS